MHICLTTCWLVGLRRWLTRFLLPAFVFSVEAFAKALPPGAINFVSGGGRATMPTLMQSGAIDSLAFIGGSAAADDLIRQHPYPHRLKIFLQLEAKNMAVSFELLSTVVNEI